MDKFYTCKEIAERYNVKIDTVWQWIRQKKLSAIKLGKVFRIKEEALSIFEKENQF